MFDTIKSVLIGVLFLSLGFMGWRYWDAWHDAQGQIAEAKADLALMQTEKTTLLAKVTDLTAQQAEKDKEIALHQLEIAGFEEEIGKLKSDLVIANKKVSVQTDDQTIAYDFKNAYGLTDANVKLINVPEVTPSGRVFKDVFLAMPVDISKVMTQTKNSEVECRKEVGLKDKIGALSAKILNLTEEKLQLEHEKVEQWSTGYNKAFDMYLKVNDRYLKLLNAPKPNFDINWLQILTGVVSGGLICAI